MTRPPEPATAHGVRRRVEALRPELPEQATVTVDFGRYPIPDIPYLTVLKWGLSSERDWPLLAGKREEIERTGTFELTDDALRRIVYDDFKRSLWQTAPDGPSLGWDDDRMRLTVSWRPSVQQTAAAFAHLGGILRISTVDLVDAQPASAEALRLAVADARGPSEPPKPAFRVEIANLVLPEHPKMTPVQQARNLYQKLKQNVLPYDSRVTFHDRTLTMEFDDVESVFFSYLHEFLPALANLQQFGRPAIHPGAPSAGTRSYPTATNGIELRAIEHAFALPGYRDHRQTQRREIATGLTYDSISRAYQDYDATFTTEHLAKLDMGLQTAADTSAYVDAFSLLFQHGGLVIGELHDKPDTFQFVTSHLADMKRAGVTRMICETFMPAIQHELDNFILGEDDTMNKHLRNYVETLDECRESPGQASRRAVENFLRMARRHGVRVVAADHLSALYSFGAGRITDEVASRAYDREKRLAYYNRVATNRTLQASENTMRCIDVHITGAGHANTSRFGYPGIAQLTCFPAVLVERKNDGLSMRIFPESRENRLTGIPSHPRVGPSNTSSSSSLTTSPAKERLRKRKRHEESQGVAI